MQLHNIELLFLSLLFNALALLTVSHIVHTTHIRKICEKRDIFFEAFTCPRVRPAKWDHEPITYLLYDVNPGEGFNLRRDVYIRMAVFLQFLRTQPGYGRSQLVLPPWSNLVHWRSHNIEQTQLPWSHFFDLSSMKAYTDVIDTPEFLDAYETLHGQGAAVVLDEVYKLKHFDNMFENGVFVDKFEEHVCPKSDSGTLPFLGYANFATKEFTCLHFQGSAMLLHKLLETYKRKGQSVRYVLVLNAEIVLHDLWGNVDYWEARRSMRFAPSLVEVADRFRWDFLNSSDEQDKTVRPAHWRDATHRRRAKGGEYICAHLRRADFLYGRDKTTPTIQSAALQIRAKLLELGLKTVFIASDCSRTEFYNLKNYLKRFRVVRFAPENYEQRATLKDGGIAIVDQIICSHARYFIGTYESTFTYRIYEEREIIGFPKDLTFNTFCKSEKDMNCEKNTVWPIVYN
ncbi:GDP-fucose protein O-fucosyltransferase 2 [Anopheles ziemanni]|uniref:GDP-fucose protein O-fucosyltransferase 2 n=1 Tax=Anopheles coustani TaxID=139045 RepID=UPI002657FB45|nr:GDP-fucose protein O-fucosyltransferase 2 [Anopheles coustani]XP_058175763.1 GDP-fucose protein O-fucosyltransferase 2 [Anopheles ziemanni]